MSSIRRAAVSKSTEVYKIRMFVPERIQVQPSLYENCPLYSIFPKDFKVISDVSQWYVHTFYQLCLFWYQKRMLRNLCLPQTVFPTVYTVHVVTELSNAHSRPVSLSERGMRKILQIIGNAASNAG